MRRDQGTVDWVPLVILDGPSVVLSSLIRSHLFAVVTVDAIRDIAVLNDAAIAEILSLYLKDGSLEPLAAVPRVNHDVYGISKALSAPLIFLASVLAGRCDLGRPAIDGLGVVGRRVWELYLQEVTSDLGDGTENPSGSLVLRRTSTDLHI